MPFWYNLFNFQFKYYSRCDVQGYVFHYFLVSGDIEFKVVLFLGNHKISISVLVFVVRQSLQSVVSSNGYWEICVFYEILLLKTVPEASTVRRLRSVTHVQSWEHTRSSHTTPGIEKKRSLCTIAHCVQWPVELIFHWFIKVLTNSIVNRVFLGFIVCGVPDRWLSGVIWVVTQCYVLSPGCSKPWLNFNY